MAVDGRKIVIWCGAAPNQRALANKLASKYNVAGIVIDEHKKASAPKKIAEIVSALIDRIKFRKIYGAWKWLMYNYASGYSEWPNVPMLRVESINNEQAAAFTREINPDLIIVSGTGCLLYTSLLFMVMASKQEPFVILMTMQKPVSMLYYRIFL